MRFARLFGHSRNDSGAEETEFAPYAFPRVNIFYWTPASRVNFGDYLAYAIVARMLALQEIVPGEPSEHPASLFSIGSVLHFARDGDTIWGSGRNGKITGQDHRFKRLDVRAVRGPLTRDFLLERDIECPAIFGDPALLIPRLFPTRFRRAATPGKIGVVPNLNDLDIVNDGRVIDPTRRWDAVIDEILSCEFVVASSLHGLIVADAFGVPCAHVRFSGTEPDFKYSDYHHGAGRTEFWSSSSVDEALSRGPLPPISFDPEPLLAAFPYDLWHRPVADADGV